MVEMGERPGEAQRTVRPLLEERQTEVRVLPEFPGESDHKVKERERNVDKRQFRVSCSLGKFPRDYCSPHQRSFKFQHPCTL